ncbi:MAG: tRNA (adenosine(37)-N6)-threonylcarbamoyltransferase complex dimerization subunit type 1 TsaB [Candidatus Doudnabacteria bacterium]|nr:tRNA (adenosine(37)-N6)-threonylcarbamoyltransferase complex dimerization subunit type 1 TsaB [Candidatus Doudnabacteria bacterium]
MPTKYTLLIDTVESHRCYLALISQKQVIRDRSIKTNYNLSEKLIPALDSIGLKTLLKKRRIDAIAVKTGPGSFSALRTGIAVANGLALAYHLPLAAVKGVLHNPDLINRTKRALKQKARFDPTP